MITRLSAAIYDNGLTTLERVIRRPANVGVRFSYPGGIQKIEVTMLAHDVWQSYDFYQRLLGKMLTLSNNPLDRPVAIGRIAGAGWRGREYVIEATGLWAAHSDLYEETQPTSGTDSGTYLKAAIDAHVLGGNLDTSGIGTTGVSMGESWRLDTLLGERPSAIVQHVCRFGDSLSRPLNYWLEPQPMNGLVPKWPKARLDPILDDDTFTWQIDVKDLRGEPRISRNTYDMRNKVQIAYTQTTSLSTAAMASATTIAVVSTSGFAVGDEIIVFLDNDRLMTTNIKSIVGSNFTLNDPLPHTAAAGNLVKRRELTLGTSYTDTDGQAIYHRDYKERRPELNSTQAARYGVAMRDWYGQPDNWDGFVIGSRTIRDANGTRWPLAAMLRNPGTIRINDLLPAMDILNPSLDKARHFVVVSLDYDDASNTMRVVPDARDGDSSRLDVVLQQLGANVGQFVQRQS